MPASLTGDLRSEARDSQRDKSHNVKWAHGKVPKPGQGKIDMFGGIDHYPAAGVEGVSLRPTPNTHQYGRGAKVRGKAASTKRQVSVRAEIDDALNEHVVDTSSDEDVHDASYAPLPSDLTYSFESPSGPSAGRNVLSAALNKAVLRFENSETEKLVTREYDVIDQLKDNVAAAEDEDYEIVEHAHLN